MSARRDDAMSAEDKDWGAHHDRSEEADDYQRHAREEAATIPAYDPRARVEGDLGAVLDRCIAASKGPRP